MYVTIALQQSGHLKSHKLIHSGEKPFTSVIYVPIALQPLDIWRRINWYIQGRNLISAMNVPIAQRGVGILRRINLNIQGRNLTSVVNVPIAQRRLEILKRINWYI